MPQVFQALRCYKCLAFQVHQVKKSNKWECKLCGEKQSMKRHYGIGTGLECRLQVQKLNKMRGETEHNISQECSDDDFEISENINTRNHSVELNTQKESKWCNYLEHSNETNTPSEGEKSETLFGKEVVLELPKKRKKVFNKNKRNKNIKQSEEVYSGDDVTNETIEMPVCNDATSYKKSMKRFVPPTTKTQSKWTEYESENSNYSTDDMFNSNVFNKNENSMKISTIINNVKSETSRFNDKNMYKHCQKPLDEVHNKSSKWTEFVDTTESGQKHTNSQYSQGFECTSNTRQSNLFSLCDDNDLDSVLNF